jgi:hypothetical protein
MSILSIPASVEEDAMSFFDRTHTAKWYKSKVKSGEWPGDDEDTAREAKNMLNWYSSTVAMQRILRDAQCTTVEEKLALLQQLLSTYLAMPDSTPGSA